MDDNSQTKFDDRADVRVPPPLIYVLVFLLGLLLQKIKPLPAIPILVCSIAGLTFTAIGIAVTLWSMDLFRRAHTSLIPIRPTTALVMEGPYRFSRNPMYLGLLSMYFGLALLMDLLWSAILMPLVILAVYFLIIRKEEQYLERKFGEEYAEYKSVVRRWI